MVCSGSIYSPARACLNYFFPILRIKLLVPPIFPPYPSFPPSPCSTTLMSLFDFPHTLTHSSPFPLSFFLCPIPFFYYIFLFIPISVILSIDTSHGKQNLPSIFLFLPIYILSLIFTAFFLYPVLSVSFSPAYSLFISFIGRY